MILPSPRAIDWRRASHSACQTGQTHHNGALSRLSAEGEIEATFGGFGPYNGQFRLGHDIAVGKDGAVYVLDARGNRVQKFVSK